MARYFETVIYNLLSNAIYFSKNDADTRIVINFKDDSLYISDNGDGVLEDDIWKLFSFGHSNRFNGHGLGLALCKEFANSRHMDIEYVPDSEFNVLGGACFKFKFSF